MRKDVLRRKELYDGHIIEGYKNGESVEDIAVRLNIKRQKVLHIAHTLGITKQWKHDTDSFIEKAKEVHGDLYDYSKVKYKMNKEKVVIICNEHGEFLQTPHMHISKKMQGCPKCAVSSPHRRLIVIMDELGLDYEINNRKILDGMELDIYFPAKKLAIEINGEYYHTIEKVDKYYHYDKFKSCEDKGIRLLQFWGTEVANKPELVTSMIRNALGLVDDRIPARKCTVKELEPKEYKDFLEDNHLEGVRNSGVRLGLIHNGEIVSVMGFSKHEEGFELDRFCSLKNKVVVGGFSKLFKHAPKGKIVSYSFNRYSNGHVYKSNGFTFERENKASLFYYQGGKLKNRNGFMKYKLRKKLGVGEEDPRTERELALELGAFQLFDAGTKTWVYSKT